MIRSVAVAGVVSTFCGAALATAVAFWIPDTDLRVSLQILGAVAVLAGIVLLTYDRLVQHVSKANRPADDAYEHGRDVGYQLGWRDCSRRHMKAAQLGDRRRIG